MVFESQSRNCSLESLDISIAFVLAAGENTLYIVNFELVLFEDQFVFSVHCGEFPFQAVVLVLLLSQDKT